MFKPIIVTARLNLLQSRNVSFKRIYYSAFAVKEPKIFLNIRIRFDRYLRFMSFTVRIDLFKNVI
jgi:hypothetical protein